MARKNDEAASLQAVPPRDFIRTRNALAASLEKKGLAAEAKRVRRLRRPGPVVWALNNAVGTPREIDALADAISELRRAQLGQREFRPAMERLRAAIGPILRRASEKLRLGGVRLSPALERRLHDTLVASTADRRLRADLAAGRLIEEQGAAGFDILAQGPIPAAPRRVASPKASGTAERRRQQQAEREAQAAARQAQREATALEAVARRRAKAAAAAAAKVEALRASLLEQEQRAAELQRAATTAEDAARKARTRA